ncbi:MAG: tetratricopeptide repeat protein [Myxococcales bacterium]|nr:tetratricopeptide repeat protein [Myxococcales bacterium]MCB9732998.1 tetratricopeptide repeat protein [Deltaproteobacteria bacterium]
MRRYATLSSLFLLLLLLLLPTPVVGGGDARAAEAGGSPGTLFHEANRLYLAGEYDDAARAYADLHESYRIEDPVLYHNLGNAYFRAGAYGSAILYYQRALHLDPPDDVADSLRANLDAARRTLSTRYRASGDENQFIYSEAAGFLYKATHVLGRTPLAVVFAVLWVGFMGLLILWRLRPDLRWAGRAAVPAAILALLLGLMVWGQLYTDASQRVGVVVTDDAVLRDGRHEDAKGKAVPEGLEVRIVEQDPSWTKVELANGHQGWIVSEQVKQI